MFQAVNNMCSHKMSSNLYDNLRLVCECHVQSKLPQFMVETMDTEQFLKLMDGCWQDHCRQMVSNMTEYTDIIALPLLHLNEVRRAKQYVPAWENKTCFR